MSQPLDEPGPSSSKRTTSPNAGLEPPSKKGAIRRRRETGDESVSYCTGGANAELAQQRKDSANIVLTRILEDTDVSTTVRNYQGHLRKWKDFCTKRYQGDCMVDSLRMLEFFTSVVFKTTVRRHVKGHLGSAGATGVSEEPRSGQGQRMLDRTDELEGMQDGEEDDIADELEEAAGNLPKGVSRWSPLSPPPGVKLTNWLIKMALKDQDSIERTATQSSEDSEPSAPKRMENGKAPQAEPIVIGSHSQRDQVLHEEQDNSDGLRVIEVPLAVGSAHNIRKALMFLWAQQTAQTAPCPSIAMDPRKDYLIHDAFQQYEASLVSRKIATGTTTGTTSCATRDTYTEEMYLRMLSFTWCMISPRNSQHKRAYNRNSRFQFMRERLCLLVRHHMLLRDDDLRNLNLADCFHIRSKHDAPGSAMATGLAFRILRGNANKKDVKMYATAYRHRNFLRCPVGGFAFYMLERFQVENEPIPNFSKPDEWHDIKVLTVGGTPEEREKRRTKALSGETLIDATASVMESCGVCSSGLTHAGRHAGCSEAYHRGLNIDEIRHLGRWSMGRSNNLNTPRNSTTGAFCLAHFRRDEPYVLERDLVTPPLELQRLIFPWIESNFDECMPEKAQSWREECDKEMKGMDPDEATGEGSFWESPGQRTARKTTHVSATDSFIARVGFLKLLVRLRRVILQDAALFLKPIEDGRTLENGLLNTLPSIFNNPMFVTFQRTLLDAIAVSQHRATTLSANVTINPQTCMDMLIAMSEQQIRELGEMRQGLTKMNEDLMKTKQDLTQGLTQISQDLKKLVRLVHGDLQSLQMPFAHSQTLPNPQPSAFPWQQFPQQWQAMPRPDSTPHVTGQQQQSRQQQPGQEGHRVATKDYQMLPDKDLTIRQAWDEFNGPVAEARSKDSSWPYTDARRRAYRRRRQFFNLIRVIAREEQRPVEDVMERLEVSHKNWTINSILQELIAKRKDVSRD